MQPGSGQQQGENHHQQALGQRQFDQTIEHDYSFPTPSRLALRADTPRTAILSLALKGPRTSHSPCWSPSTLTVTSWKPCGVSTNTPAACLPGRTSALFGRRGSTAAEARVWVGVL